MSNKFQEVVRETNALYKLAEKLADDCMSGQVDIATITIRIAEIHKVKEGWDNMFEPVRFSGPALDFVRKNFFTQENSFDKNMFIIRSYVVAYNHFERESSVVRTQYRYGPVEPRR